MKLLRRYQIYVFRNITSLSVVQLSGNGTLHII